MTFAVAAAAGVAICSLGLVVLDPYDSGRLTPLKRTGMGEAPPWAVNASRARDPQFDSAVIGNSRVQMLEPARLDALSGGRFVNLAIQGSALPEQELVLKTFLRHHPAPRALVIGVDEWWCRPVQTRTGRFPHWLYDDDALVYLRGLIRYHTFEYVPRRLAVLFGQPAMARPDGYWDYTPDLGARTGAEKVQERMRAAASRPVASENPDNRFPAVATLEGLLAGVPASTRVALVWPPTHISHQPVEGSPAAVTMAQCKADLRAVVEKRSHGAFVEWGGALPHNRDPLNFHDETHYTKALAGPLADAVAAVLAGARAP